jgi:hypothetical protein
MMSHYFCSIVENVVYQERELKVLALEDNSRRDIS